MAFGMKDAPAPPNFSQLADKQTQQNRPNQSTPFGSTSWSTDANGNPVQTTGFSGALAPLTGEMGTEASGAWSTPLDNGAAARTAATTSLYDQAASRLDPQWNQREEQMNAGLAAQGLDPSSQAGQAQIDNFNRGRNDAYTSAENSAVAGGATAAAQEQQLDLNSREAPLEGMSSLQRLLTMPGYGQAGDYIGAGQDQYNADLGQFNANGGALGGFGAFLQALGPLVNGGAKAYGSMQTKGGG